MDSEFLDTPDIEWDGGEDNDSPEENTGAEEAINPEEVTEITEDAAEGAEVTEGATDEQVDADSSEPQAEPEPGVELQAQAEPESRASFRIRAQSQTIKELREQLLAQKQQSQQQQQQQQQEPFPDDYVWSDADIERVANGGPDPRTLHQQQQPNQQQPNQQQLEQQHRDAQFSAAKDSIFDAAYTHDVPKDWMDSIQSARFFPPAAVIGVSEHSDPAGAAYAIAKDSAFQEHIAGLNEQQQYIAAASYKLRVAKAPQVSKAPAPLQKVTAGSTPNTKDPLDMSFGEVEAAENAKDYDPFT